MKAASNWKPRIYRREIRPGVYTWSVSVLKRWLTGEEDRKFLKACDFIKRLNRQDTELQKYVPNLK